LSFTASYSWYISRGYFPRQFYKPAISAMHCKVPWNIIKLAMFVLKIALFGGFLKKFSRGHRRISVGVFMFSGVSTES
jgi:hypothetical protein